MTDPSQQPGQRTPRTRTRAFILAPICALLLLLLPAPAHAQPLSDELVNASTLSQSQQATLSGFVDRHAPDLLLDADQTGNPDKIQQARRELLDPLNRAGVSTDFRITYAQLLRDTLRRATQQPRDMNIVNALQIAGELATGQEFQLIRDHLDDDRPAVRYAAVAAHADAFEAIGRSDNNAVGDAQLQASIRALAGAYDTEDNLYVLEAYSTAFVSAARIRTVLGADETAIEQFAIVTGKKAIANPNLSRELDRVMFRVCNTISQRTTDINNPFDNNALYTLCSKFAGQVLTYVRDRSRQDLSEPERADLASLANIAERILVFCAQQLNTTFPQLGLKELVVNADTAGLDQQTDRAFDRLRREPFGFRAVEFQSQR